MLTNNPKWSLVCGQQVVPSTWPMTWGPVPESSNQIASGPSDGVPLLSIRWAGGFDSDVAGPSVASSVRVPRLLRHLVRGGW